jgi:hypothetical protein
LLNADPVLLQTAPTFFGMAIDGSLDLAQMAVARLYDTTRNTMSVPKMLKRSEQEAGTFQRGSRQEVRKAIAKCQKIVVGLEPVIASIGERRNGWLAHLDPNTIADPNAQCWESTGRRSRAKRLSTSNVPRGPKTFAYDEQSPMHGGTRESNLLVVFSRHNNAQIWIDIVSAERIMA